MFSPALLALLILVVQHSGDVKALASMLCFIDAMNVRFRPDLLLQNASFFDDASKVCALALVLMVCSMLVKTTNANIPSGACVANDVQE